MKLVEHDGKRLLGKVGLAIPSSTFFSYEEPMDVVQLDWSHPWFIKAQVLQGSRGKRGFVCRVTSSEEARVVWEEMKQTLGETPCAGFLCESAVDIREEWFVSLDFNREKGTVRLHVSEAGGQDVHQVVTYEDVLRWKDATLVQAPFVIQEVIIKLINCFRMEDLLSLEVNPLVVTVDGQVLALDAKLETDDAAAFRHEDWSSFHVLPSLGRPYTVREAAYAEFLSHAGLRGTFGQYVELDGDIALLLLGGGASLIAIDALRREGGRPANYVELSGNPDGESTREAMRIVFSRPGIRAIWLAGSHANFTDVATTIQSLCAAIDDLQLRVPVVIRRDGPRMDEARAFALQWGAERGIPVQYHTAEISLAESARRLMQQISGV